MLLRFIGIEFDFVSKQLMDLIALNKGLIAQSKEVLTIKLFWTIVWKIFAPRVMHIHSRSRQYGALARADF